MVNAELDRSGWMRHSLEGTSLTPAMREGVIGVTRSRLDRWAYLLEEHVGQSPRIHFTTDSFTFAPDTPKDREIFTTRAEDQGWELSERSEGIRVHTGIVEGIEREGLRESSCVAAMPEGRSDQLVRSHPRLLLEAFRRTVIRFSKHAVPYKQTPVRKSHGTIKDLEGALVVVEPSAPVVEKGAIRRQTISDGNFLKPRTHLTQERSLPRLIVRYSVSQEIHNDGPNIWIDRNSMLDDVYAGIRRALLDQPIESVGDHALKYLRLLSCFQQSSKNQDIPSLP